MKSKLLVFINSRTFREYLFSGICVVVFVLLWQFLYLAKWINPIFIGSPLGAISNLPNILTNQTIVLGLLGSVEAVIIGLSIAVICGVCIGLSAGIYRKVYLALRPFIYGVEAIPKLVLLPIILLWTGLSIYSKIFLIVLMTIFPIITTATNAVKDIDPNIINMALSFNKRRGNLIFKIYLPATITQILNAIRISINKAFVAVVIAEFFGIGKGFGYYISYYGGTYQVDKMMAIILTLGLIDAILIFTILLIEKSARKHFGQE